MSFFILRKKRSNFLLVFRGICDSTCDIDVWHRHHVKDLPNLLQVILCSFVNDLDTTTPNTTVVSAYSVNG